MKIAHISDPHEDFKMLDKALTFVKNSDAEVLAISGDLGGTVLSPTESTEYYKLRNFIQNAAFEITSRLKLYGGKTPDSTELVYSKAALLKDKALAMKNCIEYEKYKNSIHKKRLATYQNYKERFKDLAREVILVPGNWDSPEINEVLNLENLSLTGMKTINGINFAGYGGANQSSGIPNEFVIPFNETQAFEYLSSMKKADVILTHDCPWGYEGGQVSSEGNGFLLAYMYRRKPKLILCGHTHHVINKFDKETRTTVVGSGVLGRLYQDDNESFTKEDIEKYSSVFDISAVMQSKHEGYVHTIELDDNANVLSVQRHTITE